MRRLLTGYAQQFNRRHKRHGHLFQNRYKSFLCGEGYEKRIKAQFKGFDLDILIQRIPAYFDIEAGRIKSSAKQRQASRARSILCYLAVNRLKVSIAEMARKLNISHATVSKCIYCGQSDGLSKTLERDPFNW
jgi:chromosomal replication initiation ATPase DnaA